MHVSMQYRENRFLTKLLVLYSMVPKLQIGAYDPLAMLWGATCPL
jgi:hypothetical protein